MLGVYTSQLLAVIACFLASRFIRSLPFEVSPLDPLTSVVLTLALGIGTSTAIFSVCNAVLFRPLPDPQPNRLVMLWERMSRDRKLTPVAPANFVDWREENRSFERLAAVNPLLT